LLIPIIIIFYYVGFYVYSRSNIVGFFQSGFYNAFISFQEGAIAGSLISSSRSQYFFIIPQINSMFDFSLKFIPINIFRYFLEPIPLLRSINIVDYFLILENVARFVLVLFCFKNLFLMAKDSRFIFLFILIAYLFLETMWSVGTINWGTASRHHVVSYGLLAILAFFVPYNRKYN
jgi:hypothetical protein